MDESKTNKIEDVPINIKIYYFPQKKIDYNKIMITTEGKYSVSHKDGSSKLANLIEKYFKSRNITVTDGTGNNGSDTIALGLKFKKVNSVELDKVNYGALVNNINVYGLKNVTPHLGDSLSVIPTLKQDAIYIDAPWGGGDYKHQDRMLLYMSGFELHEVYNKLKNNAKLIVFKIPKNYDFTNFIQKTKNVRYHIYTYIRKDHIKYYLLFIPTD